MHRRHGRHKVSIPECDLTGRLEERSTITPLCLFRRNYVFITNKASVAFWRRFHIKLKFVHIAPLTINLILFPYALNQGFGVSRPVPTTEPADSGVVRAFHQQPGIAVVSMAAQSCSPLDEPPSPALVVGSMPYSTKNKTKKFCRAYPCTSELCSNHSMPRSPLAPLPDPMPPVNKPASTFPVVTCYPLSS